MLATLAHVGFSARANLGRTAQAYGTGYSDWPYNAARFQHSETLKYIRDNIEGRIYSNRDGIAWFWDRTAALRKSREYRNIPRKMRWAEIEVGAHIVWFGKSPYRASLGYDTLDLRLLPGIEVVAELPDGFVLRRTAAAPFDEDRIRARKQRYVNQLIQQASERVVRAGLDRVPHRTQADLPQRAMRPPPTCRPSSFCTSSRPTRPTCPPTANRTVRRISTSISAGGSLWKSLNFRLGDQCIAIAHLPTYPIDRIQTGQWISKGQPHRLGSGVFAGPVIPDAPKLTTGKGCPSD